MSEETEIITCNKCKKTFNLYEHTVTKDLGTIGNRHWLQAGIECPHCKTFFHSFYTHNKLEKRKAKLKKMTGQQFDIEKIRIRQYHTKVQQDAERIFGK